MILSQLTRPRLEKQVQDRRDGGKKRGGERGGSLR